jgi:hypothetical protein
VLFLLLQAPDSAIARATHTVFLDPAYTRFTWWQRVLAFLSTEWHRLLAWLASVFAALGNSSPVVWVTIAAALVLLVALLGSVVLEWRERKLDVARARTAQQSAYAGGGDPWQAAQDLAARGDFTEAAHALYAALLDSAARRQQVRLHPSKTVGDYARELRLRSSALFERFRAFARVYEVVVYGLDRCDASRYQRLLDLAGPVVRPNE